MAYRSESCAAHQVSKAPSNNWMVQRRSNPYKSRFESDRGFQVFMAYKRIADRRAASKRNYSANKQVYIEKSKRRKIRLYEEVIVPAKSKPCVDCKIQFPVVCMDFDHVRGEKEF